MLFPVDSGGETLCPVFPAQGCYPENNNKASRKYSTMLSQPHNLHTSRSWLRASSMIKLNKNQPDAHQF
jgi:hypothetical protein